jgi:hypothetical protein
MLTSCTTMQCTSEKPGNEVCKKVHDKKKTFKLLRSIISNGASID